MTHCSRKNVGYWCKFKTKARYLACIQVNPKKQHTILNSSLWPQRTPKTYCMASRVPKTSNCREYSLDLHHRWYSQRMSSSTVGNQDQSDWQKYLFCYIVSVLLPKQDRVLPSSTEPSRWRHRGQLKAHIQLRTRVKNGVVVTTVLISSHFRFFVLNLFSHSRCQKKLINIICLRKQIVLLWFWNYL